MTNYFTINCISDYTKHLEKLYKQLPLEKYSSVKFIYRGQGNKEWRLTPSLLRDDKWKDENLIIQDCIRKYPYKFENLNFNNDQDVTRILSILQHYGLPTRLLDFTEDPLVALYFACEAERDKDGEIFIVKEYKYQDNSAIINSIIKYMRSDNLEKLTNEERRNLVRDDIDDELTTGNDRFTRNDLMNIRGAAALIEPYQNNERLIAQKGLFYLCGVEYETDENGLLKIKNDLFDARSKININENLEEDEKQVKQGRIIIPAEAKDEILHELDSIYRINKHSIYPEVDRYAEYKNESVLLTQRLIEKSDIRNIQDNITDIVEILNEILKKIGEKEIDSNEESAYQIQPFMEYDSDVLFRDYSNKEDANVYIVQNNLFAIQVIVRENRCYFAGFELRDKKELYNLSELIDNYDNENIVIDNHVVYFEKQNMEEEIIEKDNDIRKDIFSVDIQNPIDKSQSKSNIIGEIIEELKNKYGNSFGSISNDLETCLYENLLFGRDEDIANSTIGVRNILMDKYPDNYKEYYCNFKAVINEKRKRIREELK